MSLKVLSYRQVKRKLEEAGFRKVSQRGSHAKFAKSVPGGLLTAIVPSHREIPIGTLRSILRQARISPEEFENL